MKMINKLIAHICAAAAICSMVLVLAYVNPALAGPDCDRKPDHPSCGGGGGGGGEDPPSANPAFAIVGTSTVYLMDIDGSNFDSIFNRKTSRNMDAWAVRWSPDGNRIVYDRRYDGSLYTVDPDGSDVQQMDPLYNDSSIIPTQYFEWRHVEGLERIFFIAADPNDGRSQLWDVYVIDPHGGPTPTATRLTDGNTTDRIEGLSVSKDGTRMVIKRDAGDRNFELVLFTLGVDVDSGEVKATFEYAIEPNGITDMENANPGAWSYDSSLMLIRYGSWGYLAVMEMDPSVWAVTPLMGGADVFSPGCVFSSTWSPSPLYPQIAFDVQCFGNQPKNEGVHIVDFHGGPGTGVAPYVDNLQQVTTGLGSIRLDWRPTWNTSP